MSEDMKYFDIHMTIMEDSREGYSVFVRALNEEDALQIILKDKLYEDIEDLSNIDYIGEITKADYLIGGYKNE